MYSFKVAAKESKALAAACEVSRDKRFVFNDQQTTVLKVLCFLFEIFLYLTDQLTKCQRAVLDDAVPCSWQVSGRTRLVPLMGRESDGRTRTFGGELWLSCMSYLVGPHRRMMEAGS